MNVTEAIETAGGITTVAKKLGVPRTTVQYWSEQNKVPHWRLAEFRKIAKEQAAAKKRSAA